METDDGAQASGLVVDGRRKEQRRRLYEDYLAYDDTGPPDMAAARPPGQERPSDEGCPDQVLSHKSEAWPVMRAANGRRAAISLTDKGPGRDGKDEYDNEDA
jgi:hypothetical protein